MEQLVGPQSKQTYTSLTARQFYKVSDTVTQSTSLNALLVVKVPINYVLCCDSEVSILGVHSCSFALRNIAILISLYICNIKIALLSELSSNRPSCQKEVLKHFLV